MPADTGGIGERPEWRAEATAQLQEAQHAHALLVAAVEQAQREVGSTKLAVDQAVEALLMGEAARLAAETLAAETMARDLRRELAGLARVWVHDVEANRQRAIRLPAAVVQVLQSRPMNDPTRQVVGDPVVPYLSRWRAVAAQLAADPEAALPNEA